MIRILLLSFVITGLTACNISKKSIETPDTGIVQIEKIQHWIDLEQYGKAWDALVAVPPNHPDYEQYAQIRKNLGNTIEAYEKLVIQNSQALAKNDQWAELLDLFDDALTRLPTSIVLKDQLAELHSIQKFRTASIQTQLEINRGEELVKLTSLYDQISTINPRNESFKAEAEEIRRESGVVGSSLGRRAQIALQNGDVESALNLAELAQQLSDDPHIDAISKEIHSAQKARKNKSNKATRSASRKSKKRRKKREIAFNKAMAEFDRLLQKKDYLAAAEVLRTVKVSPKHKKEIANKKSLLNKAKRGRVNQLYEQGVNYYSQESYDLALQSWSEVLKLEPKHVQAREYSERANRIVIKLKTIRKKQQPAQ